jgi:hypothetical protein
MVVFPVNICVVLCGKGSIIRPYVALEGRSLRLWTGGLRPHRLLMLCIFPP